MNKDSEEEINASGETKEENLKYLAKIEAILFTSGNPVSVDKIQSFLKLSKVQIVEELGMLTEKYQSTESGLQIIEKKGKIQLVTKPIVGEMVAEFLGKALNEEFSKATLETLAVVAYRGPMTRVQVEYIRGVSCSYALRSLALRGVIDRKENKLDSRSYLYEVSFEFLKGLGLKNVDELVDYKAMKEALPSEEYDEGTNKDSKRVDEDKKA